ncbi:fumarylacetoacetate hydrolase family protein [Kerstersia gyiorum]|uniref:fumarylacetoacetate hydrolase family protein n=1 Tax=Kerstersia gyiorum TaxID=206506 RepID=UPI0020A084FE|nr:fumarylacetoacetate hydrolase family protein [Kerstersia gyiorum]MCP1632994.1 2-keto-4-pentenoate hydratase/2-oxohepta-3-ene-1,7-dioic acid hydratase in catechol pathway [Kerstersia gyiorum]MCP1636556.1 2-keto-4-pentenoate hydratase/2-oxohepta-3-ene-1,7-dioic acid hydratase in catechol pathway [Kerstersia gyiorum]MCP1670191.1 2-keto-4-pentenoate hydratase/2-oxohepta-3-ene-1,7-dioic acid hydratase in catechol pathway [Kerstersia gyiorum]MCP1679947.1 2-keto-4-pentenoate hydratase/2-oxohepta-3-
MRLVTYRTEPAAAGRLGAIVGDLVVDLELFGDVAGQPLPDNMLDFIDLGPSAVKLTSQLLAEMEGEFPVGVALPLANVKLLAPIPRPRKNIFGIGLNYVEHVAESSRTLDTSKELPKEPVIFSKPPTSIIGPGDAIEHNKKITQQLDWEVELAAIIGTRATRVKKEDALKYVFGYSVMIDVSARDCRRAGQWIYSKGQDTYAPFGPVIVTADEIPDPHVLDLSLTLNGVTKQSSNTRHMLFKVDTLIADISAAITLEPGDIIATGTPEGVGAGRSPQEWMWPGDVVHAVVEGIGELRHPVVDATPLD